MELGIDRAKDYLVAFHAAKSALVTSMSLGVKVGSRIWIPPTSGVFRLDVDAAVNVDAGRFGVGAVVRDCRGKLRGALAKPTQKPSSVLEAELIVILYGVGLCLQEGLLPCVVFSDSLLAIKLLDNGVESEEYLERELSPLAEMVKAGGIIVFRHMFREANFNAHSLAQYGAGCDDLCTWNIDFPQFLRENIE